MIPVSNYDKVRILSEVSATNNSAALQVIGGVNIGKNLYVGNEIMANEVIINKNIKIGKDIHIDGNIIPKNQTCCNIGNDNRRINTIYGFYVDSKKFKSGSVVCDNLDVSNNISIGTNIDNKEPVMKIMRNTLSINGNILIKNGFICVEPQYIYINHNINSIDIRSSIILLFNNTLNQQNIYINANNALIPKNATIKLVAKHLSNNIIFNINNKEVILSTINEYINILYDGDKFIYLGGDAELI